MKKLIYTLAFIFCFLSVSKAQYVNIPDANFRTFLQNKYPSAFNGAGQMDTSNSLIVNEINLIISNSPIKDISGIEYFKNLVSFSCNFLKIEHITTLPSKLEVFSCGNTPLKSISSLPDSLQQLDCSGDSLISLPNLPKTLTILSCPNNLLTSLPSLPNSLLTLDCRANIDFFNTPQQNAITSLPPLPINLQYLYCDGNKISNLGTLPSSLYYLTCNNCNLSALSALPSSLNYLYCDNNMLNLLPSLPQSLIYLSCAKNFLTTLPSLPQNFKGLYCDNNQLLNLPQLNGQLEYLSCSNNFISMLPTLPASLLGLNCPNNLIECLPKLPNSLLNLIFDTAKITCLPNKPTNLVTTLPICNATNNANGCPTNPLFEGIVYNDNNSNSKLDNGDIKRARAKISLQTGEYTFTNDTGFYQITADTIGSNTITISNPNFYNAVPQSITHNFSSYADIATDTFALQPTTTKDSLTTNITNLFGRVRSLQQTGFYCYYENVGTTNLNAIMTINFDSSKLSFDSFYHANWYSAMAHYPSSFINTGNSLVIPINNLIPGQRGFYFPAFKAKQNLIIGDSVLTNVVLTGGTAIATDTSKAFVANSFDPNDKQSTPELTPQQVQSGSNYIDYTIRFENTGNDTAFNVVVADTLSNLLRTNLVQMVSSSHLCRTTLINGVVTFEFLNINLPDSHVNKVGCHGFVRFRILPLQSLSLGAIIPNKAHIYFDYNTPVATNTATTIIANKPLPVQLSFYTAQLKKQNSQYVVENVWLTTNEVNTQLFNVQRSVNGKNFNTIGTVAAKGLGEYRFIDNKLQAIINTNIYYRLQIVDKDGKITYSTIKWIQIKGDAASSVVSIYPNPTKGKFTIQTGEMKEIIITNVLGKIVKQFKVNSEQLIANLETGVYMVKCIMTNGEIKTEKLVVE